MSDSLQYWDFKVKLGTVNEFDPLWYSTLIIFTGLRDVIVIVSVEV